MILDNQTPKFSLPLAPLFTPMRVISFGASKSVEHRLASMGISVGSVIQTAQQDAQGLVIAVENTRVAVAAGIAHKVIVTPA